MRTKYQRNTYLVVMNSPENIPPSLAEAYHNTIYHVYHPPINIELGKVNADLDVFLFDNNAFSWAFVSASNPFSAKLPEVENKKRTAALEEYAKENNWRYLRGKGQSKDGKWAEESLIILDLSKKAAIELGRRFEQYAVVYGYMDHESALLWTND